MILTDTEIINTIKSCEWRNCKMADNDPAVICEEEIQCGHSIEEIEKSFMEDVEAVKDQLPNGLTEERR